jgi:hypothetical protein
LHKIYNLLALLELSFAHKETRLICEDESSAKDCFGLAVAKALQARISDLWAAENVFDLPVGQPSIFRGDQSKYKIDLANGCVLTFVSNHIGTNNADESINWKKVTRIKITDIIC